LKNLSLVSKAKELYVVITFWRRATMIDDEHKQKPFSFSQFHIN